MALNDITITHQGRATLLRDKAQVLSKGDEVILMEVPLGEDGTEVGYISIGATPIRVTLRPKGQREGGATRIEIEGLEDWFLYSANVTSQCRLQVVMVTKAIYDREFQGVDAE